MLHLRRLARRWALGLAKPLRSPSPPSPRPAQLGRVNVLDSVGGRLPALGAEAGAAGARRSALQLRRVLTGSGESCRRSVLRYAAQLPHSRPAEARRRHRTEAQVYRGATLRASEGAWMYSTSSGTAKPWRRNTTGERTLLSQTRRVDETAGRTALRSSKRATAWSAWSARSTGTKSILRSPRAKCMRRNSLRSSTSGTAHSGTSHTTKAGLEPCRSSRSRLEAILDIPKARSASLRLIAGVLGLLVRVNGWSLLSVHFGL